jgi:hypothetical protein
MGRRKGLGLGDAKSASAPPLKAVEGGAEVAAAASALDDTQSQTEIRRLKAVNQDQAAEVSRLKAALMTYESADSADRGIKDSKIALKARLSALKALSDEQGSTIQVLRAEVASGNERLARQAAYFMEEMRRLGSGTVPATASARRAPPEPGSRPLVERINDPRVTRNVRAGPPEEEAQKSNPRRVSGFLKALDGETPQETADAAEPAPAATAEAKTEAPASGEAAKPSRRARLLERITGLDKTSA